MAAVVGDGVEDDSKEHNPVEGAGMHAFICADARGIALGQRVEWTMMIRR